MDIKPAAFYLNQRTQQAKQIAWPGICLLLALVADTDLVHADIFVYTDANGVRHFSDTKKSGAKLFVRSYSAGDVVPVRATDTSPARFSRYDAFIRAAVDKYSVPEALVRAVIKIESDYDPRVVSHAGARGLMQLMPKTAERMEITDSFDPEMNIMAGTKYLSKLLLRFPDDIDLALAAYNAGEGAVARYNGIPPYPETRNYLTKVLRFYERYRSTDDAITASRDE